MLSSKSLRDLVKRSKTTLLTKTFSDLGSDDEDVDESGLMD